MGRVFADTFYWIALIDPTDAQHSAAQAILGSKTGPSHSGDVRIVTTHEVLIEYVNFFSSRRPSIRAGVNRSVLLILNRPDILVLAQSQQLFMDGITLHSGRPDKGYSLTDCISMAAMRREGIREVLTNDRHFEQEGFQPLFR